MFVSGGLKRQNTVTLQHCFRFVREATALKIQTGLASLEMVKNTLGILSNLHFAIFLQVFQRNIFYYMMHIHISYIYIEKQLLLLIICLFQISVYLGMDPGFLLRRLVTVRPPHPMDSFVSGWFTGNQEVKYCVEILVQILQSVNY